MSAQPQAGAHADAPPPRPLGRRLPRLDADAVAALREFYARPRQASVRLGETPATVASALPQDMTGEWTELAGRSATLLLRADAAHATAVGDRDWSDYHGTARLLAWALAHEPLVDALSLLLGEPLRPLVLSTPERIPPYHVGLSLRREGAPVMRATLALERTHFDTLARALQPTPESPLPVDVAVSLSIRAAGPSVDAARLARVDAGSVFVIGARGALRCFAVAGALRWDLERAEHGFEVASISLPANDATKSMNDASPPSAGSDTAKPESAPAEGGTGADAAQAVGAIPVAIEFELGRVELTLAELGQLQPGYVFPMSTAIEGRNVSIRANGRVVGHGQIVAVGDTLGVRLVDWRGGDGLQ